MSVCYLPKALSLHLVLNNFQKKQDWKSTILIESLTEREKERERERERQTDKQTDGWTDRARESER